MGRIAIIFFLAIVVFASCNPTKNLADNETLYVGAKIKSENRQGLSRIDRRTIESELNSLTRPKPNSKLFGVRWKLMFYNWGGFFRKKWGEAPVLGSQLNLEKNRAILENRLENRGFLQAEVSADTTVKKKMMTATYTASYGPRYVVRNVSFPDDSSVLAKHLYAHREKSLLQPGKPFDLDRILKERERLDILLKDEGFFYFNPDYLIINADTSVGKYEVDLSIDVKKETPLEARQIYTINEAVIFADYEIYRDTTMVLTDSNKTGGFYIIDPDNRYNPKIFSRTVIFKPGDIYNRSDHNLTLNRLTTLGVYKFVKVRFEPVDTVDDNRLNVFYYLTRYPKRSLRSTLSALTKSNNTTGSEISVSYRNRNIFRGAELFTLTFFAGIEKQVSGNLGTISTNRFGVDANLFIPRIIPIPFQTNSGFVPKTRINLGYEIFNRTTQYTLNSFKALFGYSWKEDIRKEHQLNVLAINYVHPLNITADYQKILNANPALQRSIEKQFIIGSNYNFNYNTRVVPNNKKHNFFFNGNVDLSGNLIGLVTGANIDKGKQIMIGNVPISQYSKLEADFRHYMKMGINTELASRIILGSGWAYGNSREMPFSKAFFVGGTNSVRAFRARSLGPGTYDASQLKNQYGFIPDQPGDIKLELNTEFRTKIYSIIHGAVFVDAGNIWMQRPDPNRPGAQFSKNFLEELAVGTGVGLRFDLNFIVLRVDVAFPLRKPFLPGGPRWVFDEIEFGSREWRRENLLLNLAIGYPF